MSNEIAGYQYSADIYCSEECVLKDSGTTAVSLSQWAEWLSINPEDEYSYDSDIFPKVILTHSESGDTPDTCCKCHTVLATSWHGGTVDSAVEFLKQHVNWALAGEGSRGNVDWMDELREHLGNCIVDPYDEYVMALYDATREWEDSLNDNSDGS